MSNDKSKSAKRRNVRRQRPQPGSNGGSMRGARQGGDARANAKRNYERYMELARAAVQAGDEIEGENFYQHAEHYFRAMKEQERARNERA